MSSGTINVLRSNLSLTHVPDDILLNYFPPGISNANKVQFVHYLNRQKITFVNKLGFDDLFDIYQVNGQTEEKE
jgi:hypothetical protein